MDPELTDAEKNLLFKMIANFGTAIIKPNEPTLTTLKISRRTFYRLIDNLLKHQYIQRSEDGLGFKIAVTMLAQNSARYDTDSAKVGTEECQSWHIENEEKERTKEKEDKEYKQQNSEVNNNIDKEVTENVNTESETILTEPENNDKENTKHSADACTREKAESGKPAGQETDADLPERFTAEYRQIIDYLNEKTGKKFSARSRANQAHMSARLKEGFTVEDFKHVIDIKWFQWHGDAKMAKFLRPETLFSQKFDRYLNEDKVLTRVGLHGQTYTVSEEDMNSDVPF
jgi:uncharacterized phage protein (TIGR02220 family)